MHCTAFDRARSTSCKVHEHPVQRSLFLSDPKSNDEYDTPKRRVASPWISIHIAEQLGFQDVLALLVFLRVLVCLVVFPTNSLLALLATDISNNMSACCHIPVPCLARHDVDYVVEEKRFAMLASEILRSAISFGTYTRSIAWVLTLLMISS